MQLLASLLLALQATSPAGQGDWWYVSSSRGIGPLDLFYSDRASRRRAGELITIDEARESDRPDSNGTSAARLRLEYDCRANRGRIAAGVFLDAEGRVLRRYAPDTDLSTIEPNTVAWTLLRFACGETGSAEQLGREDMRDHARRTFAELNGGDDE